MLRSRHRRKSTHQRGFSLAELMTALGILGLFITIVVATLNALVHSSSQAQAKLETVQTAAQAFYRIQRDVRRSAVSGVLYCTGACSPNALAISTALENGDGRVFIYTDGRPQWQGVVVYWASASGALLREFVPDATGDSTPPSGAQLQADAQTAESDAASATPVAFGVQTLNAAVDTTNRVVALTMIAQSTKGGATNSTSFQSNTVPRNSYP